MSTTASPNRWVPFQCPSCFGLFRVRKSQVGETGHCPTCRSLNHLSERGPSAETKPREATPVSDEALLEKVSVAKTMTPEEIENQEAERKRRRRQYSGAAEDTIDWEEEKSSSRRPKGLPWQLVWSMVLGMGVILAAGVYYVKNSKPTPTKGGSAIIADPQAQAMLDEMLEKDKSEIYLDETGKDMTIDAVDQYKKFDLLKVEGAVKAFLTSGSVEERAKWIRDPERVKPMMLQFYGGNELEAEGFEFLNKSEVSYRGNLLTTLVQTADFLSSPIAIERVGKGEEAVYLVDWESWVGYCDMKPEDMRVKKPTDEILMRVVVKPESYYNYDFSDDSTWRSYRMELRDSEYSFLGYAKINSETDKHFLGLRKNGGSVPCIVRVVYPPKARGKDLVEIVEVVSDGWILPEKEKEK